MFEDDLFISYSHIDNLAVGSGQEGWVTSLHKSLEVRLAQLLGRMPKIWRDPKLQGNDFFSDEISDRFQSVAAMITVMSPRYVKSEWCQKEINGFCEASAGTGGIAFQGKGRVFKVIKTPVALDQHPEALQGLLGYEFYHLDPETERPREFAQTSGPETERLYWAKLDDLAYDIVGLLEAMESPGAGDDATEKAETDRERVFLAATSLDLKPAHDAVKRDLEQRGFAVLPDRPLPLNAEEFTAMVPELLASSKLSIHLLGGTYGIVPEGADRSIIELQHQLALETSKQANLERVVWISPDTEAEDPRQRSLLDFLKTDAEAQEKADILETSLEELKLAIHNKLSRNGKAKEEPQGETSDALQTIYLICDPPDLESAQPLADLLYDKGLEVILPAFEGDEAEIRLDHQENLKMCDAVILFYGSARELWLRAKLRELQKVAGYGREQPFRSKAIYVAGPTTPQKASLRTRDAMVIDGLEGLSLSLLEDFLGQLST